MKILKTIVLTLFLISFSSMTFATEHCATIETSTAAGVIEKFNCKKGLPKAEKTSLKEKLKKLNPFKKKK